MNEANVRMSLNEKKLKKPFKGIERKLRSCFFRYR